jgi:hypothetical protein
MGTVPGAAISPPSRSIADDLLLHRLNRALKMMFIHRHDYHWMEKFIAEDYIGYFITASVFS